MKVKAAFLSLCVLVVVALTVCRGDGGGGGGTTMAEELVGPAGGSVELRAIELEIPAGTFSEETTISISVASTAPPGHVGDAYELQPEGITFSPPIIVRFSYGGIDLGGASPSDFRVAHAADGGWVIEESVVDTETGEIFAALSHFSTWGLIDITGGGDGDGDADSDGDSDSDSDADSDDSCLCVVQADNYPPFDCTLTPPDSETGDCDGCLGWDDFCDFDRERCVAACESSFTCVDNVLVLNGELTLGFCEDCSGGMGSSCFHEGMCADFCM
jgi:hypothetical protein